jgi:hypothetical protein
MTLFVEECLHFKDSGFIHLTTLIDQPAFGARAAHRAEAVCVTSAR